MLHRKSRSVLCWSIERSRTEKNSHLGVEDAGGGLNNAGGAVVQLNLENLAGRVGDDGNKLDKDILGHHVQDKVVGESLLLASGNLGPEPSGGQVAHNEGVEGGVLGHGLSGLEGTANESDIDGAILLVCDVDKSPSDLAVHELDAEDVSIGEGGLVIGLELGLRDGNRGGIIAECL